MQKRKIIFRECSHVNKQGFTLVETLVAIAIFVIGIQATVMLASKTIQNKSYAMEMGKSSFVVSRSIGDLTQYIRRARQSDAGSYPIVSADKNDFVFYSDYNKDDKTERLHVYLTGGKVYMKVCVPSETFPKTYTTCAETTRLLADHIVNTTSDPLFSYYNKDYPGGANNPVATPADVSEIRLVKIFLKININPNRAPDNIQQETFVELRNLNDYDRLH
ncbi:MAG: prepilin-type N-terminal cleavage/methylation domain-containing protein [Candidatus Moranbacteria bacterium]|nr:prepilin-type N-terminal cleavage/methylation domain-containing protein [Candidatus Moranbacteria bacterium]